MKQTPILFKPEMIRAILDGLKTQTRRLIKPQVDTTHWKASAFSKPKEWRKQPLLGPCHHGWDEDMWVLNNVSDPPGAVPYTGRKCPYGRKGDLLWVKEGYVLNYSDDIKIAYKTDWYGGITEFSGPPKWKSALFMFKKYARIWLELTADPVPQRLREITEEDCIAEGSQIPCDQLPKSCRQGCMTERTQFSRIIDAYNGPGTWDKNPWVWKLEFRMVER